MMVTSKKGSIISLTMNASTLQTVETRGRSRSCSFSAAQPKTYAAEGPRAPHIDTAAGRQHSRVRVVQPRVQQVEHRPAHQVDHKGERPADHHRDEQQRAAHAAHSGGRGSCALESRTRWPAVGGSTQMQPQTRSGPPPHRAAADDPAQRTARCGAHYSSSVALDPAIFAERLRLGLRARFQRPRGTSALKFASPRPRADENKCTAFSWRLRQGLRASGTRAWWPTP